VWIKALRVHQWAKNVLVFVPLIAAHAWFNVGALAAATLAFASFCAIASATYIVNDLLDMQADRAHPRKRLRPFASGTLQPWQGIALGGSATLGGLACAMLLPFTFLAWLALYVVVTLAYSMWLKSRPVLDVVCLACLYVLRVVAGGAAVGIEVSFWLLLFSLFLFFSLALGKRYTELRGMSVDADEVLAGRGYGRSDLEIVSQLGASSAVASVLVLGLYVNAPATAAIYARPHALFAVCAVLLYWLARFWIRAHRGAMHDDPVVYALRDRASLACLALCAGAVLIAG
jgi:4-hydroxybenzoate polyprenyltransferase